MGINTDTLDVGAPKTTDKEDDSDSEDGKKRVIKERVSLIEQQQ